MNWLSLPQPLYGLVFGCLTPREVDTIACLVCRAFQGVLPVWSSVDMANLCPRRRVLRCQTSRVQRLTGWLGPPPLCLYPCTRRGAWSLRDFPGLRHCHLKMDLDQLSWLLGGKNPDSANFDLELSLWEVFVDWDLEIPQIFEALSANIVSLELTGFEDFLLPVLANLSILRRLTAVDVSGQLDDSCVWPLTSFTKLTELDVSHNLIADVSFLGFMPRLRSLSLQHTQVIDLQPLAALACLEFLDLSERLVYRTEMNALFALHSLQELNLTSNYGLERSCLEAVRTALPGCRVLIDNFVDSD